MLSSGFKRAFSYFFLLVILFLSTQIVSAAGAGSLDTTFGMGGKVFTPFEGLSPSARGIARQADGKIVVACATGSQVCLVRYNADGSLDTTFDGDGKVITNLPEGQADVATGIALQSDGKIVVVGYIFNLIGKFSRYWGFFIRYNSNGTLDTSFDGDGVKFIDNLGNSQFFAVAIQPDGKIVGAGRGLIAPGMGGVAVVRLYPNGAFDESFSNDGVAGNPMSGYDNFIPNAIAVQSDGKILVSGTTDFTNFFIIRFNADGSTDTSFDSDGMVFRLFGQGSNAANGEIIIQPDGKILQLGSAATVVANRDDIVMARYNSNGSIDTTFDGDGLVVTHVSADNRGDYGTDVCLQPDGKILVLANLNVVPLISPSNPLWGILRYSSSGSLDPTFGGGDGVATTTVTGTADVANSMLLQPDGKLLAVGWTGNPAVLALLRFNTTAQSPFDFDGDGKTDISIFRPSLGEWWYLRSLDGGNYAAQFGQSTDRITPGDFTGDGKADIAFYRSGEWFVLRSEDGSYFSHPFGTSGDIPAPADFDGDGITDEAVFRPSTAVWYILRSSGGTTIQQFGASGDAPVVGDYDSDGKADIAIFRPAVGEWWIQRSTAGTIAFQFGSSADKPVQGDYTGDGKADAAFFRPSTGEWFVLRSEDFSYYSFPFGVLTDTPAPGDYDGDGKFDAAVFRPSNSTWYIQRSTAGTLIQTFGQNGDRPVPNAFVR